MMTTFSARTLRYAKQYRVVRRPSATIIECPQRRALMTMTTNAPGDDHARADQEPDIVGQLTAPCRKFPRDDPKARFGLRLPDPLFVGGYSAVGSHGYYQKQRF